MSHGTSLSKVLNHVEWALAGLIIAAPLAMGANPLLFRAAAALASLVLLGGALWATRGRTQMSRTAMFPGRVVLLALLWTLLQAVPVPCAWLAALGHDPGLLAAESLRALGIEGSACHLSADPGLTMEALLSQVAVACAFFCAAIVCRFRGTERCTQALIVSTLAMAAVALVHLVVGATRVYGVYSPSVAGLATVSPIINSNHLGGFLVLGMGLVLARAFIAREPVHRAGWYIALLVLSSAIALTFSRGALAAAGVTCGVYLVVRMSHLGRKASGRKVLGTLALAVLGLMVVFAGTNFELLADLVGDGGVGKLEVIQKMFSFSMYAPWLGVGRGALGPAFTAAGIAPIRVEHAESELAHLAVEWGWPMTFLCVVSLGYVLFRAVPEARKSRRAAGAFASLVGFSVHSLLESQLEIPAIAMAFVVLAAISSAAKSGATLDSGERSLWQRLNDVLGRKEPTVACGTAAAVLVVAGSYAFTSESHVSVRSVLSNERIPCEESHHKRLYKLAQAHPSDALVAIMGAEHFLVEGTSEAPRWINRALDLAPKWSASHVLAAHWLAQRGMAQQAAEEVKEALEVDPSMRLEQLVCWLAKLPNGAELVLSAAPQGELGNRVFDTSASCPGVDPRVREEIDRRVLEVRPEAAGIRAREIVRSLAAGEVSRARELFAAAPAAEGLTLVHARLLEAEGKRADAVRVLNEGLKGPQAWWLLRELVRMHARDNAQASVRETLEAMRALAGRAPERLAQTYQLQAQVLRTSGNTLGALDALERGQRLSPSADLLRQIGELAESLKLRSRAYQAYDELCRIGGRDACDARERVRLAAQ